MLILLSCQIFSYNPITKMGNIYHPISSVDNITAYDIIFYL